VPLGSDMSAPLHQLDVDSGSKLCVQRSRGARPADWEPRAVTAAIVTCGGLCPGLNDVIQNIVFTLEDYGVRSDAVRHALPGSGSECLATCTRLSWPFFNIRTITVAARWGMQANSSSLILS